MVDYVGSDVQTSYIDVSVYYGLRRMEAILSKKHPVNTKQTFDYNQLTLFAFTEKQ